MTSQPPSPPPPDRVRSERGLPAGGRWLNLTGLAKDRGAIYDTDYLIERYLRFLRDVVDTRLTKGLRPLDDKADKDIGLLLLSDVENSIMSKVGSQSERVWESVRSRLRAPQLPYWVLPNPTIGRDRTTRLFGLEGQELRITNGGATRIELDEAGDSWIAQSMGDPKLW